MKLQIFSEVTISELNSILQLHFHFIKFVSFKNEENTRAYCQSCRVCGSNQRGEVNPAMREGILEVTGCEIVSDMEKYIFTRFKLSIVVYRRYNHSWISAELASLISLQMVNSL